MKTRFYLLGFIVGLFLIQSCASYKPNVFDDQNRRYKNYKSNYSIELLDGYQPASSEVRPQLIKAYFPTAPKDIEIFLNKENDVVLGMYVNGNFQVDSQDRKIEILNLMEKKFNDEGKSCTECEDYSVERNQNGVIFQMSTKSEQGGGAAIITMIPFPLTMDSTQYGFFNFVCGVNSKQLESAKADFLKMSNTLQLPAFEENERSLQ